MAPPYSSEIKFAKPEFVTVRVSLQYIAVPVEPVELINNDLSILVGPVA